LNRWHTIDGGNNQEIRMNRWRSGFASALCLVALSGWMSGCGDDGSNSGPDAMSGPAVCNDGVVGAGELCDPAAPAGTGACCNATCDGFLTAGTECRAAAGECDVAETCGGDSGACPEDALATAGTECRPATGECDVVETCDGAAGACPTNAFTPDETTCDDCVLGPGNCTTCSAGVCIPVGGLVVINEIDADTAGADDVVELIELYDGGPGETSLDGMVLVFIDGEDDTVYRAFDLSGFKTDQDGFFLIGSGEVVPAVDFQIPTNLIQNGTDAVAVYQGTEADFAPGTAASADNLRDAVVYGLAQDADLATLLTPGQSKVNEAAGGNAEGHSVQRVPDGAGGPQGTSAFQAAPPTPGAPNQAVAR
jgi:hypothetical protein